MNFSEAPEFSSELKKFGKLYRSMAEDLAEFKNVLAILHLPEMSHIFSGSAYAKLSISSTHSVIKARFDCAALGNKQLLRIIVVVANDGTESTLIELYAKNNKPREDTVRIRKYFKPS
jgi:hypothetical protein